VHAFFERSAQHLKDGGLFIFDFWYSPAVFSQKPSVRVKRIDSADVAITRIAEPVEKISDSRVDVHYTIFSERPLNNGTQEISSFNEIHSMRHFTLTEIDLIAKIHGFIRIKSEEFLTGRPLDATTWGALVVLKKIK
jgi:hypothetical protein